jgi:hypothetical protein
LTIYEYAALLCSINESIYSYPDDGSFLIGDILRLYALDMLFVSFLSTRRRVPVVEVLRNPEIA